MYAVFFFAFNTYIIYVQERLVGGKLNHAWKFAYNLIVLLYKYF